MKTQLKLNSIVPHGIGSGPESGAIDLIYSILLQKFEQDFYRYISIYQVGDDAEEVILKEPGDKIYVNIKYPTHDDFETKSISEKNLIRLDAVHTALIRIAEYDKKLEIEKLEIIRKEIIEKKFSFDFECKTFRNKKEKKLLARIIVNPQMEKFDYYVLIENGEKLICKSHIFSGGTNVFYLPYFFNYGIWKENEFILTGTKKEVEIHILIKECLFKYINLTPYDNPPYFTIVNFNSTTEEKEKASKDWKHSLPPEIAAIIRQANN